VREIKFRAWDKAEQALKEVIELNFSQWWVTTGEGMWGGERNSFKNEETDRHILMQYTGLKDKNGKEIYEGDIINDSFGDRKGRIRYNDHVAAFEISEYDGIHMLSSHNCGRFFEVIGNIYENPELLEAPHDR
jgi:uncharacterized phage protein (TIGR01671 family)